MPDCDRCHRADLDHYHRLRNVYYEDDLMSKLESVMVVCPDCFSLMVDSDLYEL